MTVTGFFQKAVGASAGLTLAYWFCVLVGMPQGLGQAFTLFVAIVFCWVSGWNSEPAHPFQPRELILLTALSLVTAAGTSMLYAFNPDDSTFFHRIAYLGLRGELFSLGYDTRLAFDQVAPVSAAHLATSWEYALARLGHVLGSDVTGYQIGGTFVSVVLYILAVYYTISHFTPKAAAATKVLAVLSVIVFLFFDADQNRRIGAWFFLGGWTGKCFLAAALIALFPAFDRARESGRVGDWFFLLCLMVFLMGLTSSALFILPVAIGALVVADWMTRGLGRHNLWALGLMLLPLLVGAAFVGKFGALRDDSYWRAWQSMPFSQYATLTLSSRSLALYLVLVGLLLWGRRPWLRNETLRRFAMYQVVLFCVLLNPLLLPVFQRFVPSDGFWRIFYLFQYPTVAAIVGVVFFESLRHRDFKHALVPGALIVSGIVAGSSVFSLQAQWGYPVHFKGIFDPKLPEAEYRSIIESAKACERFSGFSIVLAPEQWEVTSQMLAPSLQSVAGRHMRHNFLNTGLDKLKLGESSRSKARDFVSASGSGSDQDFRAVMAKGVDIVAMRPDVAVAVPMPGYRRVYADNHYVVFCRD